MAKVGESTNQGIIPYLKFPEELDLLTDEEGVVWKTLCDKVREACETHGYFLLHNHNKTLLPSSLIKDMFGCMKTLFDLPEETKTKYKCPKPYCSYTAKCPVVPLHESFGIDDPVRIESAEAFTQLMWPQGNPKFCETLHLMSSKMLELNFMILKMIFESFGISKKHYHSYTQDCGSVFRVMKYKVPPSKIDSAIGLVEHTDKNRLTILCQEEVQGLEILSKDGDHWVQVDFPQDALVIMVGDALKAWSNGRLHAAKHRVMMRGDKERYSCGIFSIPREGTTIKAANKLVDQDHPLRYRPFKYSDYISYFVSNISDDALEIYAGL